jgi:hypothetical protein
MSEPEFGIGPPDASILECGGRAAQNGTASFDAQALLDFINADTDGMITLIITTDDVSDVFNSTNYTFVSANNANTQLDPRLVLTVVPEPTTFALLGVGLMAALRRRGR